MLRNYFTTAFRNLRRNRSYALLNGLGLALGIAACLVIFLVVRNELTYDHHHRAADRTYRVGLYDFNANVSMAVAPAMRVDFPELAQITQVYYQPSGVIRIGERRFKEVGFAYADQYLPRVFDYQWLAGNPATALAEPNAVVLTESVARKYFGEKEAMGRTINLANQYDLKVTGIIRDPPGNTHLPFPFLVSLKTAWKDLAWAYSSFWSIPGGSFVYAVIPENTSVRQFESRMPAFVAKNWEKQTDKTTSLLLQPLKDIPFDQRYKNNLTTPTPRSTYWALAAIAGFILATACINFVNLATAQALRRAKEVGVRKVLGANRSQLIGQFLGETTLLVLLALGAGLVATHWLLPRAARWLDIRIDARQLGEPAVVGLVAAATVVVILLAGLYPAFVQSAFRPVASLKGAVALPASGGLTLRKSLVVLQFAISQILIVGTLVVAHQMDYFQHQDLGFNGEAILSFEVPDPARREVLRQRLLATPGVRAISFSSAPLTYNASYTSFSSPELGMIKDDVTELKFIDDRFVDLFGLELLAGGLVTQANQDTVPDVVVNETLMHKLGIQRPREALGKTFLLGGGGRARVTGVVRDFQSESKHRKRGPCVLAYRPDAFSTVSVKIQPREMRQTVGRIDRVWSDLFPDGLFDYEFLDEHIASLYRQEQKVYVAFRLFSTVAILIGCLGLYGLVSFTAVQRTKEIGIRKILGASVSNIVALLSGDFLKLVLIANVIAWPVAWWAMNGWLEDFAYRIHIGGWTFALAGGSALVIALLTISYRAVRAAVANPVKSLRTE
ncbi:MAG: ABC transporter permease [Ferruginibacter sp.]|nr:ABC transporter permease [Cytophagales bacterium]